MTETPVISRSGASRGSIAETSGIRVEVSPDYQAGHSSNERSRYVFSYRIRITNGSSATVQLLRRSWSIIDADGDLETVEGDGVVGDQPTLAPGESYEYASWCQLETAWGTMEGHYTFFVTGGPAGDSTQMLTARIARFFLVADEPSVLAPPRG